MIANNNNQLNPIPQFLLKKGNELLSHTKQEYIQAKQRIAEEYHDFLILLPQNLKIHDNQYEVSQEARNIGIFSIQKGTYIPIEKPYVTVDGRVQMARDEHHALGKRLDIGEPIFKSINDRLIVSVTIVSEILGSATGTIEVGKGGGVDTKNPIANAQTSAIGRALGFLGYGLVGTGVTTSADEMDHLNEQNQQSIQNDMQYTQSNSSNRSKPLVFRVQIAGNVYFNNDGSSTVPVMLETRDKIPLSLPTIHQSFAKTIKNGDILLVTGWLNDTRLRAANEAPVFDKEQAV